MVEDLLKCLQLTINSLNSNLKVKLYGSRGFNKRK